MAAATCKLAIFVIAFVSHIVRGLFVTAGDECLAACVFLGLALPLSSSGHLGFAWPPKHLIFLLDLFLLVTVSLFCRNGCLILCSHPIISWGTQTNRCYLVLTTALCWLLQNSSNPRQPARSGFIWAQPPHLSSACRRQWLFWAIAAQARYGEGSRAPSSRLFSSGRPWPSRCHAVVTVTTVATVTILATAAALPTTARNRSSSVWGSYHS